MKKLIVAVVGLAVFAPGAFAASSSHFLKVTPSKAAQGQTVTVSGSVGNGCQIGRKGDAATIFSKAFKGAKGVKGNFAGQPAISASLAKSKHGAFSIKVTLASNVKPAKYSVGGRCGGGNFGTTTLKVTSGLPQGY